MAASSGDNTVNAIAHGRPIDLGVDIPVQGTVIEGDWSIPLRPTGSIILVNGTGNSRLNRRNRDVARQLYDSGFATLLLDLLTLDEEREDSLTGVFHLDIPLFAERLLTATHWLHETEVGFLPLGYLASGPASAAAIVASVREPGVVSAIVSRGGRPDLAGIDLHRAVTPTLLIVGSDDERIFELNRWALRRLGGDAKIAIIPGASHTFEEPNALEKVGTMATRWFCCHMPSRRWPSLGSSTFDDSSVRASV